MLATAAAVHATVLLLGFLSLLLTTVEEEITEICAPWEEIRNDWIICPLEDEFHLGMLAHLLTHTAPHYFTLHPRATKALERNVPRAQAATWPLTSHDISCDRQRAITVLGMGSPTGSPTASPTARATTTGTTARQCTAPLRTQGAMMTMVTAMVMAMVMTMVGTATQLILMPPMVRGRLRHLKANLMERKTTVALCSKRAA